MSNTITGIISNAVLITGLVTVMMMLENGETSSADISRRDSSGPPEHLHSLPFYCIM